MISPYQANNKNNNDIREETHMSSEKTNRIFNTLYANRIIAKRDGEPIINLSLVFCIIAFLTAPWLVIGGVIAALALGYKFSYASHATAFTSTFDTVVQDAKDNVRSVVDAVTDRTENQN